MQKYFSFRVWMGAMLCFVAGFLAVSTASSSPASAYSTKLKRYPYLTDVVGSYATLNWTTDRSKSGGGVRYGRVGTEACTAHYVAATKTAISINGVLAYQWKAQLNLVPGAQYCYRVYLGTSTTGEADLLGSDASPSFWTQVPIGSPESFSFLVFGDWGQVNSSGANPAQAKLMSLMAASGARFAVTTGDNGYPSGSQKNFGDLVQVGASTSAIFGPSFWKVPGASLPIFPVVGNHGMSSSDTSHPYLVTWPQDRAVSTSAGRYKKEIYCCLNGTTSKTYPSAWYAFDAGIARFYVLTAAWADSNIGTASAYKVDYDYHWAPSTAQYRWLKADLAAHPSGLKFAFLHYPIYSDGAGSERSDTYLQGSSSLEGLLKANGVDIAFTGHSHIYERNRASAAGVLNYVTGGGGATLGSLSTCTSLDAYAIKFTTTGKACGSAPKPTSANQVYHFLKVTVNGTSVTVTPINALGQAFDVQNYNFATNALTLALSSPADLTATAVSGTQIDLSWSATSDNAEVRGYGVYRDGELINTVDANTLTYSDTGLLPSTSYSYQVDAFDGIGSHSDLSTTAPVATSDKAVYAFTAVADAHVPTTSEGLADTLRADASPGFSSYLRFHVGDLSGTVTKATLRLYATSDSSAGYQAYTVTDQSWEEDDITHANAPAPGMLLGASGNVVSDNWITIDVTSLVTGNGIYDLVLPSAGPANASFNSREADSNPPELVIETSTNGSPIPATFASPSADPTSTPAPTDTVTPAPTSLPSATDTPVAIDTALATSTATTDSATVLTFLTEADARVARSSPTKNYGASTNLRADSGPASAQTSYIRFTVSGMSGTIQSAKLRLFCTTNLTTNGPAVYLADNDWIESGIDGITWNNQPALLSTAFDNKDAIATSTWAEYDVTELVTGDGTYTFALVADGKDGVTFSSREGAAAPQLVVTSEP